MRLKEPAGAVIDLTEPKSGVNTPVSVSGWGGDALLKGDDMPDLLVVLLVEDSEDDITVIRKAFERARIPNPLYVVKDGEAAIAYLAGKGKYAVRDEYPVPALVLLDLKLPGMDGFEVLRWIRQTPGMSGLRVVVLTSSDSIRDVNAAYELGANSFMVKEMYFQNTVELARLLKDFWLVKAKVPESARVDEKAFREERNESRE